MSKDLDAYRYLRDLPKNSKIKIEVEGEVKEVTLIRRGRQSLRVQGVTGDSFLVAFSQVLVVPEK